MFVRALASIPLQGLDKNISVWFTPPSGLLAASKDPATPSCSTCGRNATNTATRTSSKPRRFSPCTTHPSTAQTTSTGCVQPKLYQPSRISPRQPTLSARQYLRGGAGGLALGAHLRRAGEARRSAQKGPSHQGYG